ncbi:trypsin-like serine protease [Pendulispora rubella]|uniref:Trypsin-like serine protease n=1 Tax=Pendulispora rubella TaxID=2741070 RepID=A0ABZ2L8A5_9BACT
MGFAAAPPRAVDCCSGEVISPTVILTAAHCVDSASLGADTVYTVVTGPNADDADEASRLEVLEVHAHPQWDPENIEAGYDIGVAILA